MGRGFANAIAASVALFGIAYKLGHDLAYPLRFRFRLHRPDMQVEQRSRHSITTTKTDGLAASSGRAVRPVSEAYRPAGRMETVGDLPVYLVGPENTTCAVIVLYDIFGMHDNIKQFCDILSDSLGVLVALPDSLRGHGWDPVRGAAFECYSEPYSWLGRVGNWGAISPDLMLLKYLLLLRGITRAGIVGFRTGAGLAVVASAEDREGWYRGAVMVQPPAAAVAREEAEMTRVPVLVVEGAVGEGEEVTEFLTHLLAHPTLGPLSQHHRLPPGARRGRPASRADYANPLDRRRATEAVQVTANFLAGVLDEVVER